MHHPRQPVVLFDGYCHLCSGSVRFIIKRDKKKVFYFLPLQSGEAARMEGLPVYDKNSPASIILIENNKIYQKSGAALRITRHLRFPWNLLYAFIIIPAFIRDGVYMFVSGNRYRWFGKRETCYLG